jgi:deoxyribodipyrimidine photo-lyase
MTSALLWFRSDLRIADNPALLAALKTGLTVIPIYILDDKAAGHWKMGAASRVWLHHSLESLNANLNSTLSLFDGNAEDVISRLIQEHDIRAVFWNRCAEPLRKEQDKALESSLIKSGITVETFSAGYLWEPGDVLKSDGTPYRVFTPYYRKGCLSRSEPREPYAAPKDLSKLRKSPLSEKLSLLPESPRWDLGIVDHWHIGESGARKTLDYFLDSGLKGYAEGRNYPARDNVSRVSPYLHWGEISPHQVWHDAKQKALSEGWEADLDRFLCELGWREFSAYLLNFTPDMPDEPIQKNFSKFPWAKPDPDRLKRWQRGETGFPIVDAGMRELWATGYMHNRVRMIVASFLVKDLRYHWKLGEEWFWDTLVDADLANNAASWQWVAGCGADAAPYFRIFNPVTQGEKFDPDSAYINRWAPDSCKIPPILNHSQARIAALEALKSIK